MLARHSVLAPTRRTEELAKFAASPWPAWPVQPGNLTPRGADLGHQMGQFTASSTAAAG